MNHSTSILVALLATVLLCLPSANAQGAEAPLRDNDRVAIVGNTFADQLRIHGYLETRLVQELPGLKLRNLGWAGDTLTARARPTNFPKEEVTLTAHKTDVIIACFGMGESFAGLEGIDTFKADLKDFIAGHAGKKYNGTAAVRLILVSPIACENLGTRTPNHEQRIRELAAYTKAMSEVASETSVPFIDLFFSTKTMMAYTAPNAPKFTTNGIVLNQVGYWALSDFFSAQLTGRVRKPWRIELDAKAMEGSAQGATLGKLSREQNRLRLSVTESVAPGLPAPKAAKSAKPDLLIVENLAPGSHTLRIDGTDIATATHDQWARGVTLDASPAHREAESLRAAINDKNLQFTYGWKALNQVHIVGERRKSASGKALPAEVKEFDALAKQRQSDVQELGKVKTREWTLEPK